MSKEGFDVLSLSSSMPTRTLLPTQWLIVVHKVFIFLCCLYSHFYTMPVIHILLSLPLSPIPVGSCLKGMGKLYRYPPTGHREVRYTTILVPHSIPASLERTTRNSPSVVGTNTIKCSLAPVVVDSERILVIRVLQSLTPCRRPQMCRHHFASTSTRPSANSALSLAAFPNGPALSARPRHREVSTEMHRRRCLPALLIP